MTSSRGGPINAPRGRLPHSARARRAASAVASLRVQSAAASSLFYSATAQDVKLSIEVIVKPLCVDVVEGFFVHKYCRIKRI